MSKCENCKRNYNASESTAWYMNIYCSNKCEAIHISEIRNDR